MSKAIVINSLSDLREAINHPYRNGEYFYDGTQVLEVTDDEDEMTALIETYDNGELSYHINWESKDIFTEDGTQIPSIY